ncbi:biogenesis of lysosome-related organelles complex 1 subunit 4 [Uranotaenia lowii]|uniref:biogenesis of lysosome-related organelles complex 1 subunit 4 n=1 Tax=Uranotaenia lowii TaxID=190385 RepID=UPI00247B18E6|nr:biogenesis of lysosome-related organelles complex 1 subunit 4 [Uranotaenia lowii]
MTEEHVNYTRWNDASNLQAEIQPITARIEDMLLRLEEFEALLELTKAQRSVAVQQNIGTIVAMKPEFDELCSRIDQLERFVAMVSKNLEAVEKQVQIAEEELDIPDKTINVLLKSLNIFSKPKTLERQTNRNASGVYQAPTIFKTSDYFGSKEVKVVDAAGGIINEEGQERGDKEK